MELERVNCPRCGSGESAERVRGRDFLHGSEGDFTAVECARCGFWFLNPRPTRQSIGEAYPSEYLPHALDATTTEPPLSPAFAGYLSDRLGYRDVPGLRTWRPRWWQRWQTGVYLIPEYVPGGRLLEIGSATGARLRLLRSLGWENLTGIELSERAAGVARSSGLDVRVGAVEEVIGSLEDASYDTVIASFVLEHMFDPFAVIDEVARVLKPGGEFLLSTVTRDSLDGRIWERYWSGFDFPRHLIYFETSDLRDMLDPRL